MKLGSKTHAHKILGRGPGHHTITLMDPTKKKRDREKKPKHKKQNQKKNQQRVYLMSMKLLVYCVIIMLYRCPLNNFNIATTGQ